jgi:hypothetical protein
MEAQANLTERELEKLFAPIDSGKLPAEQPVRSAWYQAINPTEDLESEFLRRIS